MATILADISLRLRANGAELKKGLDEAKAKVVGFKGQISTMGKSLSGSFKAATSEISSSLNAMTGGLSGMLSTGLKTFKGLAMGMKGLTAAFISTGIGAVILAITTAIAGLVAAFKRSGTASDQLEKAIGFLKGVLNYFLDLLVKVGEWLIKVFTDPKTAIKELWNVIKEQLVNRFNGVVQIFVAGWEIIKNGAMGVAYAIKGIFDKDAREKSKQYFADMAKGLGDMGKAVAQVITGKTWDDLKQTAKDINAYGKKGVALADLKNQLVETELKTIEKVGTAQRKLADLIEQYSETSNKTAEGRAKREKIVAEQVKQQQIINAANLTLKKAELAVLEEEIKQSSSGEATDEQKLELAKKRQEVIQEEYDGQKKIAQLRKKDTATEMAEIAAIEKAKEEALKKEEERVKEIKDLKQENVLLQIKDEQKLEEAKLAFDRDDQLRESKSAEAQQLIWENYWLALAKMADDYNKESKEKTKDIGLDVLDKSLEDTRLNYDEKLKLLEEAKAKEWIVESEFAEKKRQLDEEERVRKLEVIDSNLAYASNALDIINNLQEAAFNRETKAAGDNEAKKEAIRRKYAKKQKALSIAQALINGAEAITKVLAQTGILSPLAIPFIAATTAAQIALIASQPLAKGGLAYGPTMATVGEYPNAKNNPEVIAPLDKLKNLLGRTALGPSEVKFVIEQDTLVGILTKYDNKNIYF